MADSSTTERTYSREEVSELMHIKKYLDDFEAQVERGELLYVPDTEVTSHPPLVDISLGHQLVIHLTLMRKFPEYFSKDLERYQKAIDELPKIMEDVNKKTLVTLLGSSEDDLPF